MEGFLMAIFFFAALPIAVANFTYVSSEQYTSHIAAAASDSLTSAVDDSNVPLLVGSSGNPSVSLPPQALRSLENKNIVKRYRVTDVKFGALNPRNQNAAKSVQVELFDGTILTIDKTKTEERSSGNYTWHGTVRGYPKSSVIFTVVKNYLTGNIEILDQSLALQGKYDIVYVGNGLYSLRELDFTDMEDESEVPTLPDSMSADRPAGDADVANTVASDVGDVIDIMIVYSNQTAAAAGASIDSQIQAAVDAANAAYFNSNVNYRLRLVHTEGLNYNEASTNAYNTALSDITSGTNGAQAVPTLRDYYKADLVSMFIESPTYCGMGWLGLSSMAAFTVVARDCAAGYYSLAHEIGHNMGLNHDPATEPSLSPYAYGHGYIDPSCAFRTVMAYAGCGATRVGYHSNPNLMYPGTTLPMGTTDLSDAVRVLNQNARTVANYRTETSVVCERNAPIVTVTPANQIGTGGQSLPYTLTVKSADSSSCVNATFVTSSSIPAGFIQSPASFSFSLAPGAQVSQTMMVTAPAGTVPGTYAITESTQNSSAPSIPPTTASANYVVNPPDLTAPVVTITNPADGSVLPSGKGGQINVTSSASDQSGIKRMEVYLNDVLVQSCTLKTSCTYKWAHSKAAPGQHSIKVIATDNSPAMNKGWATIVVTK